MINLVNFLSHGMAFLEFEEFPNLIEYFTTTSTSTLLKEDDSTMVNCTLLKDIKNIMYYTKPYFSKDTPNQILHMLSTLILWSKSFYTTTGQYATLYDFLAIAPNEILYWNYYLTYPNKCAKQNIL